MKTATLLILLFAIAPKALACLNGGYCNGITVHKCEVCFPYYFGREDLQSERKPLVIDSKIDEGKFSKITNI